MLGAAVYEQFKDNYEVLATDIRPLDIWCQELNVQNYHRLHYELSVFEPQVIVNLAALTDLEYCETHGQEAVDTNTGGSANLTALAAKYKADYVYISTAGIFDGKQESYDDADRPNPLCMYGKTKYWGELIAKTYERTYVIRPGWMMGGGPAKDKKFINKIFKQLQAGQTELNVVTDKCGTPTYTYDLAKTMDALLESGQYGTYNCTCKGRTTRYEVAVEFIRLLGLEEKVKVNQVTSDFFKTEYYATRPDSEIILSNALDRAGLNRMRDWKECLAEYVKEFK